MPKRANKWVIHEEKNGTWGVSKGGRFLYQDLATRREAILRMKPYHKPGEPVWLEEPDGYRTDITKQLKRGGIL